MRTLILILVGLVVATSAIRLAKPGKRRFVAWMFCAFWLLAALVNLSVGLSHGYSLREELPIHLLLFGMPALAAWWLSRPSR